MDSSTRLRIATRIHFALLRQYGANVGVGALLKGGSDAREALWVCEASGDAALAALSRQLRHAQRAEQQPAARPAPQEAVWARNTTGFGLSRPLELDDAPAKPARPVGGWLRPANWGKRAAAARRG